MNESDDIWDFCKTCGKHFTGLAPECDCYGTEPEELGVYLAKLARKKLLNESLKTTNNPKEGQKWKLKN